ncbi:MAG: ChbG/HpnK family deacetylase [Prochlorococcus sp.]
MTGPGLLNRLTRYGAIGVIAAMVHAGVLISLSLALPEWLANPIAFLAASLAGYLGHSLVTFRMETGGKRFARRWLLLQYAVNLFVCGVLPLVLPASMVPMGRTLVLVFTPTVLNALIWSKAARFSARRLRAHGCPPHLHADDLGLAPEVNTAILDLATSGRLKSASLLVNAPAAEEAIKNWQQLPFPPQLTLHLCLTEGPSKENTPDLPSSFGRLLLASFLPRQQRISSQLEVAISSQIERYRLLTGEEVIHIDGHQHIHLVPIVLTAILNQATAQQICWIRTTAEPLPTGLPLRYWWQALHRGGLLKWLLLQLLSALAMPRLKQAGISSNAAFAGVLFTGHMTGEPLKAAWRDLSIQPQRYRATPPLLLAHPAAAPNHAMDLGDFQLSESFLRSPWREKEWRALQNSSTL